MKLFLLAALIAVAAATPIPPPIANTNENSKSTNHIIKRFVTKH